MFVKFNSHLVVVWWLSFIIDESASLLLASKLCLKSQREKKENMISIRTFGTLLGTTSVTTKEGECMAIKRFIAWVF